MCVYINIFPWKGDVYITVYLFWLGVNVSCSVQTFFFFFFFWHISSIYKFPGQGLNLSHSSDNTRPAEPQRNSSDSILKPSPPLSLFFFPLPRLLLQYFTGKTERNRNRNAEELGRGWCEPFARGFVEDLPFPPCPPPPFFWAEKPIQTPGSCWLEINHYRFWLHRSHSVSLAF